VLLTCTPSEDETPHGNKHIVMAAVTSTPASFTVVTAGLDCIATLEFYLQTHSHVQASIVSQGRLTLRRLEIAAIPPDFQLG
jgi:hypothetical protein